MFQVGDKCNTFYERDTVSARLKQMISNKDKIHFEHQYFVSLPESNDQINHFRGEVT